MTISQKQGAKEDLLLAFIHSKLDDYSLDPYELRIYNRVVRRAGGYDGTFFESAPNMATGCKISERKVRYVIDILVSAGFISEERQIGFVTRYRLNRPDKWVAPDTLSSIRQKSRYRKIKRLNKGETEATTTSPLHTMHEQNEQKYDALAPMHDMQGGIAPHAWVMHHVQLYPCTRCR
jgi:hypothetical protein